MKLKASTLRFTLLLFVSLLATCASAFLSSTESFPAQELGIVETVNSSDYRETIVWGAPFRFAIDMLNSERIGQIDGKDNLYRSAFFVDWLFWFALSWPLWFIAPIFVAFCARFVRAAIQPNNAR